VRGALAARGSREKAALAMPAVKWSATRAACKVERSSLREQRGRVAPSSACMSWLEGGRFLSMSPKQREGAVLDHNFVRARVLIACRCWPWRPNPWLKPEHAAS
jgi:hypothetical protein